MKGGGSANREAQAHGGNSGQPCEDEDIESWTRERTSKADGFRGARL